MHAAVTLKLIDIILPPLEYENCKLTKQFKPSLQIQLGFRHFAAFWTFVIPVWCQRFEWGLDYLQDVHPFLVPFLMPVFHMFITGSDYLNLAST